MTGTEDTISTSKEPKDHPACVFCQRAMAKEFASADWQTMRFEPLNPRVPGHMLFVPIVHVVSAMASPYYAGKAAEAAAHWGRSRAEDFNLITSCGPAATQTVPHLHFHYLPRRPGDGLSLPWSNL